MEKGVGSHRQSLAQSIHSNRLILVVLVLLGVILSLVLVTWLNLVWRPDVTEIPPDSGFYAYIGKAILHGQVLYRDVWDDKPPLGYYLNALAQTIFGQNSWGVWWSSVVWISGCIVLFFGVVKKLFGGITAGIISVLFLVVLMNPELFQGGNLMEVYALVPQIGIIGITYLYFIHQRKPWLVVLAGVATAVAYLIKQPTIVLGCASFVVMMASRISEWKIREAIITGMRSTLGFFSLVALTSIYWLSIGAFSYFLDGAILQGFSFIGGSQSMVREYFFYTLVNVLPKLLIGRLYLIALLTGGIFLVEKVYQLWLKPVLIEHLPWWQWCLVIALLLFPLAAGWLWPGSYEGKFWLISVVALGLFVIIKYYRVRVKPLKQQVFTPIEWTWLISLIALPVEVLMASLGGRYFGHYFIMMIPAMCLALAYPISRVISALGEALKTKKTKLQTALYMILAILSMVWGLNFLKHDIPTPDYTSDVPGIFKGHTLVNNLEEYIIQTTHPDDDVLVWHIHLGINFITDRKAPSRFLFPLNLFIPPTAGNKRLEEYVNGLEANPPELIVVQRVSSLALPFVDQPVDQSCQTYCTPEFMQALTVPQIKQHWLSFQQFFSTHYALDANIYDWVIYRRLP